MDCLDCGMALETMTKMLYDSEASKIVVEYCYFYWNLYIERIITDKIK